MGPFDGIDIHDSDPVLGHDKECRVGIGDIHATDPIAQVFNIPCSYRIFKLSQMLLDDPAIFFRQTIYVFQYLPLYFEVQIVSPRSV